MSASMAYNCSTAQGSEQSIRQACANQYDGTYECVRENIAPNADPIDLLEELGGE